MEEVKSEDDMDITEKVSALNGVCTLNNSDLTYRKGFRYTPKCTYTSTEVKAKCNDIPKWNVIESGFNRNTLIVFCSYNDITCDAGYGEKRSVEVIDYLCIVGVTLEDSQAFVSYILVPKPITEITDSLEIIDQLQDCTTWFPDDNKSFVLLHQLAMDKETHELLAKDLNKFIRNTQWKPYVAFATREYAQSMFAQDVREQGYGHEPTYNPSNSVSHFQELSSDWFDELNEFLQKLGYDTNKNQEFKDVSLFYFRFNPMLDLETVKQEFDGVLDIRPHVHHIDITKFTGRP